MCAGSEIESAAHAEIEIAGHGCGHYGGRRLRAQGFLDRPQRILVGARLDQQQPADIEAVLVQAVSVGAAEIRQRPPRGDEHGGAGSCLLCANRQCKAETERGRLVRVGRGHHLVQHTAGETGPSGQMGLQLRSAERQAGRWHGGRERTVLQTGHDLAESVDALSFLV